MFLGVPTGAWSALALVVALLVAWHNHWRWSRDSARVVVSWQFGRVTPYMVQSSPIPGSGAAHRMERKGVRPEGNHGIDSANVEVLIVRVENGGRTGVTVSSPSFEFHPWRIRPYRKLENLPGVPVRRSMASALLDRNGACTKQTHRLQPFDEATFIMRAEPLLAATKNFRPCWIRAVVRVAGKSRECRSSLKTALKLREGQMTIDGKRPEFSTVVYRGLFPHDEVTASMVASHTKMALHKNADSAWSDVVTEMMPWASDALMGFTTVDSMLVDFDHITESESQEAHARRMAWMENERRGGSRT